MDIKIYDNIMSNPPAIDKEYLINILCLSVTQLISEVDIFEVIESNTALTIKFKILIKEDGNNDSVRQFFIKTIKYNANAHDYHELSIKEVEFYKFIHNATKVNIPLAKCFDTYISDDKLKHLLLLEDLSNEFHGTNKINLASENIWVSAACSLAKFHAAFWNSEKIGSKDLPIDNREKNNINIKNTYKSYEKFIKYIGKRFDAETLDIFDHALKISVELQNERYKRLINKDSVTINNGDSHIYNFMFPDNPNKSPIIIDFQFWGIGIGAVDVAHLTRVSFPQNCKEKFHQSILEKYHQTLLEQGIQGYSWDNCWKDYKKHVASMLLIPMWQYTLFNLEYDDWINDVSSLILNYKLLHCEQLEV